MSKVLINLLVPRDWDGKTYGPGENVSVPSGLADHMGVKGTPVKEGTADTPLDTRTRAELGSALSAGGVEFDSKANRDTLLSLAAEHKL